MKHMNETYRDNCTAKTIANTKEEINMINTGMYKNYGLLEDEAQGTEDIDEFVFQNGGIVNIKDAEESGQPFITSSEDPVFCA